MKRARTSAATVTVTAAAFVLALVGCSPASSQGSSQSPTSSLTAATGSPAVPSSSAASGSTAGERPGSAASGTASSGHGQVAQTTASAELATLAVAAAGSTSGYQRSLFGNAWTDDNDDPDGHNGCDTRNDILRRDLTAITDPGGCVVRTGTLHDPYTGRTINFVRGASTSSAVQIDHVVALGDAWQTGAAAWGLRERTDLANDPLNLLAVDGPTNERKGDGDAASFEPPNRAYDCAYVARQIAVKARYKLWVTTDERAAMATTLSSCPAQPALAESGAPPANGAPAPTHASTRAPAPTPAPTSAAALSCTATVDDPQPPDYATIHVLVHTAGGASVTVTAHYKSKDTTETGQAAANGGASIGFAISRATVGYRVGVDVVVSSGGRTAACATSFTPR